MNSVVLMIFSQTAHQSQFAYWVQSIASDLSIGNDATLKVKIKGEVAGAGASIAIGASIPGVPGTNQCATTEGNTSITGSFDWKEYSVSLKSIAKGTSFISV